MKDCLNCGSLMADAAYRCPTCGVAEGARVGRVSAQRDEPLGFEGSPFLKAALVGLLILFAVAALVWVFG